MSDFGYKSGSSSTTVRRAPVAVSIAIALLVSACGGGGGEADEPVSTEPPPVGTDGSGSGPQTGQAPVANANGFLFQAGPSVASDQALDTLAGGRKLWQSWNPGREQMLTPGMKVSFFGRADDCAADLSDGPVAAAKVAPDAATLSKMALAVPQSSYVRDWQPSGRNELCSASARDAVGPSHVVLSAHSRGAVGLYTTAAATTGGEQPFFGPYDAGGQNGKGANAYNTSSFVTFRMDWKATPRRPWAHAGNVARIYSRQSIGLTTVKAPAGAELPVQAKQFLSVAFINNACAAQGITAGRPCAVKYLFPLTIAQAGISDWSKVGWFNRARVWFDPVQGNMPIVEGSPPPSGKTLSDPDSGLPIFSSAGEAAQHAQFYDLPFDMRISFAQLTNVLRIVTGRQGGVSPAGVTNEQLKGTWGSQWADPAQWSLVTVAVGQEVHNPYSHGESSIGGAFSSLYVGPQD
jgi:hypothetical protein